MLFLSNFQGNALIVISEGIISHLLHTEDTDTTYIKIALETHAYQTVHSH